MGYALQVYDLGIDEVIINPVGPQLILAKIQAWQAWSGNGRSPNGHSQNNGFPNGDLQHNMLQRGYHLVVN